MMSNEINATDCSDEDIIEYIENLRGEDTIHYQSNWIIIRALKILFRNISDLSDDMNK